MGNLKKCKHCGKEVAKNAKSCPSCGGKFGMPFIVKVLCLIFIIILIVVGCAKLFSDAVDEVKNEYNDINGKTSFKVGETFENKHLKIKFESFDDYKEKNQFLQPKSGYKYVVFKLSAKNVGKEDEDFSYWDFECYADDKNMEQYYFTDDGLTNKLSEGKSADQPIYCEVPKDAKKITIEYKALFDLSDKHIEFIGKE